MPSRSTYLDDDGLRIPQLLAARIGPTGELPALLTAFTGAFSISNAEEVLGHGGGIAWLGVETAGGGLGVAVAASALITAAVLGDGCFVGLACDE